MFKVVSPDIERELESPTAPRHTAPGPLKWYDKEMRCASRGCRSPSYCKVEGIPYCVMHALHKLDILCHELTTRLGGEQMSEQEKEKESTIRETTTETEEHVVEPVELDDDDDDDED